MYIRRVTPRRTASGETYHSYRLVESRREGGRVRQVGRTLNVRKATQPEPKLKAIYEALGLHPLPGGTRKMVA